MQLHESIDEESSDEYRESSSNNVTIDYKKAQFNNTSDRRDMDLFNKSSSELPCTHKVLAPNRIS